MLQNVTEFGLTGKGLWLENSASALTSFQVYGQRATLTHAIVRVADGADALNADVVTEVQAAGVPVWGAVRLYDRAPTFKPTLPQEYHRREAETAIHMALELKLAGLVLEAREGFNGLEGERVATTYVNFLRADLPNLPLALSSWSYPPAHPNFPGREFRAACQVDMPFVFSAAQLRTAHAVFSKLSPALTFAPVVPAFASQQFAFTPTEFAQLLGTADELQLPALSVWQWHTLQQPAQRALAETFSGWRAPEAPALLADADEELSAPSPEETSFGLEPEPSLAVPELPEAPARPWLTQDTETGAVFFSEAASDLVTQPIITRFFKALRTGQLAQALECFAPEFTHLNPQHVTRNPEDVAQFYRQLFARYPSATLAIQHIQGSARLVAVQWVLHAVNGELLYGQDSFHLNRHNQIVYHDTQFQEVAAQS